MKNKLLYCMLLGFPLSTFAAETVTTAAPQVHFPELKKAILNKLSAMR
jgi:hypothetical protein